MSRIGRRRWILLVLVLAIAFSVSATIFAGAFLAKPANRRVGPPPKDLGAIDVRIPSTSGTTLAAWFIPGRPGTGGILLLHGIHADRWGLVSRARFLHRLGYSILMIDFQAHGESPGKHITFGYLESRDVEAAAAELDRRLPNEPLGAIGVSMGGAAILVAEHRLPFRAVVLESVYPTIESTVRARVAEYLGPLATVVAPLLLIQMKPRLGFSPGQLRPIEHIATLNAAIFVMSGSEDTYPTPGEAYSLYQQARAPKFFWTVPGAQHNDLHEVMPRDYEDKVNSFFLRYLK
jgi:fermentation-respiration switch protein FrsA (DUF1100 family)